MTNNTNNIGLKDKVPGEFYREIYKFIMKPIKLNIEEYKNYKLGQSVKDWKESADKCVKQTKIILDLIIPEDRLTEDQIKQLEALKNRVEDWRYDFSKYFNAGIEEEYYAWFNDLYILSTSIIQGGVLTEDERLDQLEKRVEQLKKRVDQLEKRVEQLEKRATIINALAHSLTNINNK